IRLGPGPVAVSLDELAASATLVSWPLHRRLYTLPVLGLTMWTCLQAKQTTPSYIPRYPRIHCPRTNLGPDGRYSGRETDVAPWSNRDPGQRLCIGGERVCDWPPLSGPGGMLV